MEDDSASFSDEVEVADVRNFRCAKLGLPARMAAFLNNEELQRDCEQIPCDQDLLEDIAGNYIIVKKILSYLPWQDKLMCKNVCSMWRSAINTLRKEQLAVTDFAISMRISHIKNGISLIQSDCFYNEPLAVLAFANISGFTITAVCEALLTNPCDPPCDKDHNHFVSVLDVVKNLVVMPKKCMIAVKASAMSYMPTAYTPTNKYTITRMYGKNSPFIGGIFIPVIPNVQFDIITVKTLPDIRGKFIKTMDKLSETRYVKGALVFVNGSFILQSVDDIVFLNYLKNLQPDYPFALGGCIVEDTVSDNEDMSTLIDGINNCKDLLSFNLVSVGIFTVPKNFEELRTETGVHFEMYSLILDSGCWAKGRMEAAINEFSKCVPRFEHSVVVKMSCVGRDSKHDYEQNLFRTAFPNTRLVGCYGNGELGISKPERLRTDPRPSGLKRYRPEPPPAPKKKFGFSLMYSYASIFVYIGWGKILRPADTS
ncbi:hypothetical protein PYW07_013923 [Mythimna separata]|uniref:F-box domain-containing protein n=1 Tax=Mythimna separata TaxID=271217 RepID=A0AAD8DPC0_MYTSE|nr:hypothetical protein PYW07_013923 [Mythimna separata]